ncbi:APC family permease [Fodinicola acaciae]|uniref:APC family permease n=1 Tax=Fodinicola acaciae TaxID=2681555 RepID=UPI0013D86020|nr:APC family permease [Fodinicola acaciae]
MVDLQLRRQSPVAGLDRRRLGPAQVIAQSVSAVAPSAAMATSPAIAAATAGSGVTWSFVVATGIALVIGRCIGYFTRRMAAAGSLYSLTAKGLGPTAAFASGCALLVGYGVLAMGMLTGCGLYLGDLLSRLGIPVNTVVAATAVLVLGALATACTLRGVRLSAQVVLIVEAMSIALMLTIFAILLVRSGRHLDIRPFSLPLGDLGVVAAGVLPALGALVGFEASAALGVEARRPYLTIPRAVQWTAALSGVLFVLASYTQVVGLGRGLANQGSPMTELIRSPWLSVALDFGIAASFFACTLATLTALSRVLFSMGRDEIAPRWFGATHPRHRTPHLAIFVAVPVVTAVPFVFLVFGAGGPMLLLSFVNVAVTGYLVSYLLICASAPVFLRRIGELTVGPVLAAAVVGPVLLAVLVAFLVTAWRGPYPYVFGLLSAAGLLWHGWLRWRRPAVIAGIGVYDETSAEDVLGGASR